MMTNEELKNAKKAYLQQSSCKYGKKDRLGNIVEMKLTFDQWLDIWIKSGHWFQRGNKTGYYVMARHNDIGHYELGNITIKPFEENCREAHAGIPKTNSCKQKLKEIRTGMKFPLRSQDYRDSRKKRIKTPDGIMLGIEEVSNYYKVSKRTVSYWLTKKSTEYYYL